MSFKSKNGNTYGSAYVARRHDRHHDETVAQESKEPKQVEAGEKEGVQDNSSKNQVVAEHGRARKVIINHDHEAHKHHVTSQHEDGHTHESEHDNPEAAHAEGNALAEVNPEANIEPEDQLGIEPDQEDVPHKHKHTPEPDGFNMPSLD